MPKRRARAHAVVGSAALTLLAVSATAAQAAPAADPVDVSVQQRFVHDMVAPGGTVAIHVSAGALTGRLPHLALTTTLPAGVTYAGVGEGTHDDCTVSADGRTLTCVRKDDSARSVSASVNVKVGQDVPVGTDLSFTTTADIGDTVDPKPANNTESGSVKVRQPADLGIAWQAPPGPVKTGQDVKTSLTVTNHGPGAVPLEAVRLTMDGPYGPETMDHGCWWDPYMITCDVFREVAPGETVTLPFTWNFPDKAAGTTQRVPTELYGSSPLDGNPANDKATLVLKIVKGSQPTPTPKPTPTPTPTSKPTATPSATPAPTPSSSTTAPATGTGTGATPRGGDGRLAATGTAPLTAVGATAAALTVAGGALVLARRTRRREH
ncbi:MULTISPECIES: hypothetical protein [unclassified Streptomyces]|uniref:hypothetical protein n=1 Tax=unclassified Streptomyces TaxID=2593676 RepID=UPI0036FE1C63